MCKPKGDVIERQLKYYYAHPMSWYDTAEEEKDIEAIKKLGVQVINPNTEQFGKSVKNIYRNGGSGKDVMDMFCDVVGFQADAVVFRRFRNRGISAGVAQEILAAMLHGKPVYEILMVLDDEGKPYLDVQLSRPWMGSVMSIAETKQMIRDHKL